MPEAINVNEITQEALQIRKQLNVQLKVIENLHKLVHELKERLSPVVFYDDLLGSPEQEKSDLSLCDVARELHNNNTMLIDTKETIDLLIRSLEI